MRRPVDLDRKYRCCCGMIEVMSLFDVRPQKTIQFHCLVICVLVYLLAFSLPFLLCFRSSYSAYSAHLESINAELTAHKAHLEEAVEARTVALQQTNASLHREIKERAAAEKEKEKLIKELQTALSEVKTLSGLLPICASCKKIRDDKGYWMQIESYISEHSKAEFSHGICPECAEKLYPDFGSRRHS